MLEAASSFDPVSRENGAKREGSAVRGRGRGLGLRTADSRLDWPRGDRKQLERCDRDVAIRGTRCARWDARERRSATAARRRPSTRLFVYTQTP
eukprot:357102-Chlamydomonas_euryale.AAC.4